MATVIQLFDDLDNVGHGVAEANLVRMMTVVMVVVRLLMVSPDRRRCPTLSAVYTATGNNSTTHGDNNIILPGLPGWIC